MNSAPEWRHFESVLATTHPLDAYGGVRISPAVIHSMVAELNTGNVAMLGHHDRLRPLRTRDLRASAISLPDGELAVQISGEVHHDDWSQLGDVRAMSFGAGQNLDSVLWPSAQRPDVTLAADAAWFDAEDIAGACSILASLGGVKGQAYFQFSLIPDAKIIIDASSSLFTTGRA